MNRYKMRIHVEMLPCDEAPTTEPVKAQDGSVSIVLSETDAMSIDACEQALLQTTYPTLRETLATHLSELAKKKPWSTSRRARCIRIRGPIESMASLVDSSFRRIGCVSRTGSCMIAPENSLRHSAVGNAMRPSVLRRLRSCGG